MRRSLREAVPAESPGKERWGYGEPVVTQLVHDGGIGQPLVFGSGALMQHADDIGSIFRPRNWNLRQEQFALRPDFLGDELRAESDARKISDVGMDDQPEGTDQLDVLLKHAL